MRHTFDIATNNQQCTIKVHFMASSRKQAVRCEFKHIKQPSTTYYDHTRYVDTGKNYFYIRLPQSPEIGILTIESNSGFNLVKQPKTNLPYEIIPLHQKLDAFSYKNAMIKEFVNWAQWFCEDFVILSSGGSVYQSPELNFRIDVHDILKDRKTGLPTKSPARIGVTTRIIEVAYKYFLPLTVPGRFVCLDHELGHGFLNVKMESEFEADRNALNIALGLGYPRSAVKKFWFELFTKCPTDENLKRWNLIRDYIDNFGQNEASDEYYYKDEPK